MPSNTKFRVLALIFALLAMVSTWIWLSRKDEPEAKLVEPALGTAERPVLPSPSTEAGDATKAPGTPKPVSQIPSPVMLPEIRPEDRPQPVAPPPDPTEAERPQPVAPPSEPTEAERPQPVGGIVQPPPFSMPLPVTEPPSQ